MEAQRKLYYSSREVAKLFGVEDTTVTEWARSGKIIGKQIGTRWFFPKEQFDPKIVCSYCNNEITEFKDEESYLEGRISGMCQDCQDKAFGETE